MSWHQVDVYSDVVLALLYFVVLNRTTLGSCIHCWLMGFTNVTFNSRCLVITRSLGAYHKCRHPENVELK